MVWQWCGSLVGPGVHSHRLGCLYCELQILVDPTPPFLTPLPLAMLWHVKSWPPPLPGIQVRPLRPDLRSFRLQWVLCRYLTICITLIIVNHSMLNSVSHCYFWDQLLSLYCISSSFCPYKIGLRTIQCFHFPILSPHHVYPQEWSLTMSASC